MSPKIIKHESLADFLSSIPPSADNVRLNLALGTTFEWWLLEVCPQGTFNVGNPLASKENSKPDQDVKILVSVWENDQLCLVFTKIGAGQCRLASPLPPSHLDRIAISLLPSLTSHLLSLPIFSSTSSGPSFLRTLAGPDLLVLPFLEIWPHPSSSKPNLHIHACSIKTPPPISTCTLPKGHSISLLDPSSPITQTDLETIAQLRIDFFSNGSHNRIESSIEDAIESLKKDGQNGGIWIYRVPLSDISSSSSSSLLNDQKEKVVPVGFLNTGRPTLRTIAIRGLYVSDQSRGQGIGQRLIAHVTRIHLVEARQITYDFTSTTTTTGIDRVVPGFDRMSKYGKKEEVCLFVETKNEGARRLYRKLGFEESRDTWGDYDLVGVEKGGW